jgi:hypothetical protein
MWDDKQVHYQEWDRTTNLGCICFFMDLGVAEGLLFRTGEKRNGKYVYASLERKTLN